MNIFNIIVATFIKHIGEMKYYKLNYFAGIILNLILFGGIFNVATQGEKVAEIVLLKMLVGFLIWYYSIGIISRMSELTVEETMLGTLEQIIVTQSSLTMVLISTLIVDIIISSILILIFISFVFPLFNLNPLSIAINYPLVLLIFLSALISVAGVGFIFFGLSLYFKRIGAVSSIFNYVLLFFSGIFFSPDDLPQPLKWLSYIIPISWPLKNLKFVIVENIPFFLLIKTKEWIILWISTLIFIIFGILIAKRCYTIARTQGKFSYY